MIAFIIWLIGWFVSYAVLSRVASQLITSPERWDNIDRGFCAGLSISSWFMVLLCLTVLLIRKLKKFNALGKYIIPLLKKLEPKDLRNE